jgi:hypothetical protein
MIRSLSLILFLTLFSIPAQSGFFDCVCNFITGKDRAERIVSCLPDKTLFHLKDITPEKAYKLTLNNGTTYEGVVKSINSDLIEIYNGQKIINIKPKHLNTAIETEVPFQFKVTNAEIIKSDALKRYVQDAQIRKTYFIQNKEQIVSEINLLKQMSDADKEIYIKKYADELEKKIKEKFKIQNLGYHFNNNGGLGYQYAETGGIFATMGDYGTQLGIASDYSIRVYLFRSETYSLFDVINQYRMKNLTNTGRMGDEIILINLDHPYFNKAIQEKGILSSDTISYEFDTKWLDAQDINLNRMNSPVGIPYETFLFSPAPVYQKHLRFWLELGGLDRMEENFLALKSLESQLR